MSAHRARCGGTLRPGRTRHESKEDLVATFLSNRVYFLVALLVLVLVVLSLLSPYFLDLSTILGITRFGAVLAIVAIGQSLIILAGEQASICRSARW